MYCSIWYFRILFRPMDDDLLEELIRQNDNRNGILLTSRQALSINYIRVSSNSSPSLHTLTQQSGLEKRMFLTSNLSFLTESLKGGRRKAFSPTFFRMFKMFEISAAGVRGPCSKTTCPSGRSLPGVLFDSIYVQGPLTMIRVCPAASYTR